MVFHTLDTDDGVWMSDWPSQITVDQERGDFYIRERDHFVLCPLAALAGMENSSMRWITARDWFIAYLKEAHPEVTAIEFWPPSHNL